MAIERYIRRLGKDELAGKTIAGLKVGDIIANRPRVQWSVTCSRCGVVQTAYHDELVHALNGGVGRAAARCKSALCGKQQLIEELSDTPAKARAREADRQADIERQREDAFQKRLDELKSEHEKNLKNIGNVVRQRIANLPDKDAPLDRTLPHLTGDAATEFNQNSIREFLKARPGAVWNDKVIETLAGYFERNNRTLVSAAMLSETYDRLSNFGFIEPAPKKTIVQSVPRTPVEEPEPQPTGMLTGIDPETGQRREYTPWEQDRMDAATFRKTFRPSLQVPNVGPGALSN